MTILDGILAAIQVLMKLYLTSGGGFPSLVTTAAACEEEIRRIKNAEAAIEKAAMDAVPK